jgi:outer membrane protein assembly factor BamB
VPITRPDGLLRVATPLLALALVLASSIAPAAASTATAATGTPPGSWTVYHRDALGDGVAPSDVASVHLSSPAWRSPVLDGQLYGEPLVLGGRVYVATENDTVYALSAATGAVEWSTHVGTPVPAGRLPCGDISPLVGITGTPVIDPNRNEIFVVADMLEAGSPAHVLVGLETATGKTELNQNVDPAGAQPAALLQRTGLALDSGHVVFGMGGNFGDCASYRGRVVSVPESGGTPAVFTVDDAAGESQGAVWMGGAAPVVDAEGNVWVTTGNGSVHSSGQPFDDSDAVLELSSGLSLLQYFAPSDWPSNNARDLDMSDAPALLGDGQVVVAGKAAIAYLLDGTTLGGIGGQQATAPGICGSDVDGGVAVSGTTVILPCASGPVAVAVSSGPAGLHVLWRASAGGGPPILAAGAVWTIEQDGILFALSPTSGAVEAHATIGLPANHFSTPSVGAGLLLAPTATRVVAFATTSSTSSSTTTSTSGTSSTAGPPSTTRAAVPHASSGSTAASVGAVAAVVLVFVALALWLVVRRRGRHR